MKEVSERLSNYLHTEKQLIGCDLYSLTLASGMSYYFTDADCDVIYGGKIYLHNELLIKRQQVKLNDRVVVDTMNITIHADANGKIEGKPIKQAAHDGTLDRASLHLSRCFFEKGTVIGTIGLFGGLVEVKKCGGLQLELTVKAKTQGLSQEFPRRKYYPQGAYTTADNKVSSQDEDSDSCLIAPFVPLKEVLL